MTDAGARGPKIRWLAILTALAAAGALTAPWCGDGWVLCPHRLLTGLPCAFCGLTRSLCVLTRGDLAEGWRLHPFGPALAAAAVLWVLAILSDLFRGTDLEGRLGRLFKRTTGVLAACFIGLYFYRVIDLTFHHQGPWTTGVDDLFVRFLQFLNG